MYDTRRILPPDEVERRLHGAPLTTLETPPLSAGALEARNTLAKARLAFEAKQKEKEMPDIKTALENALKKTATAWAADDEPHQQMQPQEKAMTAPRDPKKDKRITTNVSRATFNFVRNCPGKTREQITQSLISQGFKATSITSLLGQMVRARLVMQDADGKLTAVVQEYQPISVARNKTKKTAKAVPERKQITIISKATGEVLNAKPLPVLEAVVPTMHTAESVLASMSVAEAHKLWVALNKMFGG